LRTRLIDQTHQLATPDCDPLRIGIALYAIHEFLGNWRQRTLLHFSTHAGDIQSAYSG
jgi:hypothetical protein